MSRSIPPRGRQVTPISLSAVSEAPPLLRRNVLLIEALQIQPKTFQERAAPATIGHGNPMLERVKDKEQPTRNYCVGSVDLLLDIPSALEAVSAKYCLFLAFDATSINAEEIRRTAKMLLERGIAYFCVWGPECERVHDLFDLERLPEEPRDNAVMTT